MVGGRTEAFPLVGSFHLMGWLVLLVGFLRSFREFLSFWGYLLVLF